MKMMDDSPSITLETTKTCLVQAESSSATGLARSLRRLLIHTRWNLARKLRQQPSVFIPLIGRWRHTSRGDYRGFSRNTEIVIDAYPRSANTFATYAFLSAQTRPVEVCHHHHAAATLLAAASRKLPALTIIREPTAAIRSFAMFRWASHSNMVTPRECVECAIKDYLAFYRPLVSARDRLFVARFKSVTSDYGEVLSAFRERFHVDFETFKHTPENVARVYRMCDEFFLNSQQTPDQLNLLQIARPRSGIKEATIEFESIIHDLANNREWDAVMQLFKHFDTNANL